LDLGKIWAELWRNLDKIEAKFGQKWLDLGKIKILHPQKHSIFYGYTIIILFLFNVKKFILFQEKQCFRWLMRTNTFWEMGARKDFIMTPIVWPVWPSP